MKLVDRLRSVRVVLTVWYSAVLLTAFALFGTGVYVYLEHLLSRALDENLVSEVDWVHRVLDAEFEKLEAGMTLGDLSRDVKEVILQHFASDPRNYIIMLTSPSGTVLFESVNRPDRPLVRTVIPEGGTVLIDVEDEQYGSLRVAVSRSAPFVIQIAYPDASIRAALDHVLSIFGLLIPFVLLFSAAGGWVVGGIALSPVRSISRMARKISAENLRERIPARPVPDELGELIETINGMIGRIEAGFLQIRQFSMDIAHELKTPLTIMKGETELALTGPPLSTEELRELLSSFLEETVHLSRLVDDLLLLARAEAGQLQLRQETFDVSDLVGELFEDAQMLAAPKSISVTLENDGPAIIFGDPDRIRQMLRNLVLNALHYTEAGGSIALRCATEEGTCTIAVADTGVGIPPSGLERVFERFYRADETAGRSPSGTGLGLPIARRIAEAHGGSIHVFSTPGKGSTFTVRLPLVSSPAR